MNRPSRWARSCFRIGLQLLRRAKVRGTTGPGGPLGGPEFQILTSVTALERANFVASLLGGGFGADVVVDYTPFTALAADSTALVDYCSLLFMGGRMSPETRMEIINAVRPRRTLHRTRPAALSN
jgi:hypothetical protein